MLRTAIECFRQQAAPLFFATVEPPAFPCGPARHDDGRTAPLQRQRDVGLYDAVDPASGTVSRTYLALDQAMLFVAVANHLTGNRIPARFGADPMVAPALPVLAAESFFD